MASKSLRRPDVQAKFSLILSILAGVGFVGMVVLFGLRYDAEFRAVTYGDKSLYAPVFLLGAAGTMLLSAVGLILGFNSAGQRRNELQKLSWISFFLGTAVLAGAAICLAMFWLWKNPMPMK